MKEEELVNIEFPTQPEPEVVEFLEFKDVIEHLRSGGTVSVEDFGLKSLVTYERDGLYLKLEGSLYPMEVALEGKVLMSKKWVIR